MADTLRKHSPCLMPPRETVISDTHGILENQQEVETQPTEGQKA